jgi:hypothetical protein
MLRRAVPDGVVQQSRGITWLGNTEYLGGGHAGHGHALRAGAEHAAVELSMNQSICISQLMLCRQANARVDPPSSNADVLVG